MSIRRGRRSSLWWERAPRAQMVRRRGWINHAETAAASKGGIAAAVVFVNLAVRDRDLRRSRFSGWTCQERSLFKFRGVGSSLIFRSLIVRSGNGR
jgi:hypothetical protein